MSRTRFAKRLSLAHLTEGMRLALDTLVGQKLRSSLVILGVAIAVATSMAMVAIMSGLGQKIVTDIKGGDTPLFSVRRFSHLQEGDADPEG